MKGMTSLLVIFAAVVVVGMLFFTKKNVISGFANKVAAKVAPPAPKAAMPIPMPSAPKASATTVSSDFARLQSGMASVNRR